MKLTVIIALFSLNVMVSGWVAFLQPIVLSIGAAFTALTFDAEPMLDFKFPKWLFRKGRGHQGPYDADPAKIPRQYEEEEMKWDVEQQYRDLEKFMQNVPAYRPFIEKGWLKPDN